MNLDPIADAIAKVRAANAEPSAIVLTTRDWAALQKIKTADSYNSPLLGDSANGASPRLFGIPVYTSSQLSVAQTHGTASDASSAYVFDGSQVVVGRRADVGILIDPYSHSANDQTLIRATSRWDVAVAHPGAVCVISGITPTNESS